MTFSLRKTGQAAVLTDHQAKSAPSEPNSGASVSIATSKDKLDLALPLPDANLVKRALEGGEVHFRNDQGGTARLSITQTGEGRYSLALDGKAMPVEIDDGLPAEEALARIADYYSQLPPHMREGVSEIEVSNKEKKGAAATTYGGKRIVFWQGMTYLRPGTFFHEFGHVNAKRVYGHTDPSDAWDRAQGQDGKFVTDYSKTNDNEDFAEMMEAYFLARRGEGDLSLEELQKRFPGRTKILEDVIANRPVETKDSDYWRIFGFNVPKPDTVWQQMGGSEYLKKAKDLLAGLNPFA